MAAPPVAFCTRRRFLHISVPLASPCYAFLYLRWKNLLKFILLKNTFSCWILSRIVYIHQMMDIIWIFYKASTYTFYVKCDKFIEDANWLLDSDFLKFRNFFASRLTHLYVYNPPAVRSMKSSLNRVWKRQACHLMFFSSSGACSCRHEKIERSKVSIINKNYVRNTNYIHAKYNIEVSFNI